MAIPPGPVFPSGWSEDFEGLTEPADAGEDVSVGVNYSEIPFQVIYYSGTVVSGRSGATGLAGKGLINSNTGVHHEPTLSGPAAVDFYIEQIPDAPGLRTEGGVPVFVLFNAADIGGDDGWYVEYDPLTFLVRLRHKAGSVITFETPTPAATLSIGRWYTIGAEFGNGSLLFTLKDGATTLWTSATHAMDVVEVTAAALVGRPVGQTYEARTRIDNFVWGVPAVEEIRVTRQFPRDDAYGLGSAPRIFPPPRRGRVVGGYT